MPTIAITITNRVRGGEEPCGAAGLVLNGAIDIRLTN